MRRVIGRLTALDVKRLGEGVHADGGGLYLQIAASGARCWCFRYQRDGERHEMGLGATHAVGLARARERAAEARGQLAEGIDPLAARRAQRAALRAASTTFEAFAESFITAQAPGWRAGGKNEDQWRASMRAYVYPRLGAMPLGDIGAAEVLAVLTPAWTTRPVTADKVRGRIEAVLDAAKARGLRAGENPARWRGHLDNLLPATKKIAPVVHFAALDYHEMPAFMTVLRQHASIKARVLEFSILTAGRSGECLGAQWSEIDVAKRLWIVPPGRMKVEREHRVPLSDRALAIIAEMAAIRDGDYLFPGRRGKPVNKLTMFTMLRDMGRGDITAHGFRSAFRDWCGNETSFPREIAEQALAHASGDQTERAYRRSDALEKRRQLMTAWSAYCDGAERGNVVVALAR